MSEMIWRIIYFIAVIATLALFAKFCIDYYECTVSGGQYLRGFFSWNCYSELRRM